HLEGSRRLSGDVIHNQFLEMAKHGNFADFPSNAGPMANAMMAGDPMMKGGSAGSETAKRSGEGFNLFRGGFNAAVFAYQAVPPEPRRAPQFSLAGMLQQEGVTDASAVVDAMMRRFLRVPVSGERRESMVAFAIKQLGGAKVDYQRYT